MTTTQLNLSLLLPTFDDRDRCVALLTQQLSAVKGVEQAHIVGSDGDARLCLHYDPNLLPLARIERLAQEAGAALSDRYRHEQIAIRELTAADSAVTLSERLATLPGMVHTDVSYAAGLAFVAYDSSVLTRPIIEQALRDFGTRTATPHGTHDHEEGHDHGGAPTFLPHWVQERWTVLLLGLGGLFLLAGWLGERYLGLPPQVTLAFFALSYLMSGYDIATHALPGLLRGKFDTDVLMLAAAAGAAILGDWAEGAFLLFLFGLAHVGEHYALDRARSAINGLGALMPKTARVKQGGQIVEVAVESLQVDARVIVPPGERVPVDGVVEAGESTLDQSAITGESAPVARGPGDALFAGSINHERALEVRVTRLARDNTLSRVMALVAEAQSQQSPTQALTQRFMAWFVPTVLVAALLMTVVPPLLGWLPWRESFYRAMLMLVAASPCALALGTPATVLAGIAQAARNGVLIKGGVHLENLGRLDAMAFDKTGTLTEGRFELSRIEPMAGMDARELLALAAGVEQHSTHPLAQAVVRAAVQEGVAVPAAEQVENIPGYGIHGVVGARRVWIGASRLFEREGAPPLPDTVADRVAAMAREGSSTMVVARGEQVLGVLAFEDQPRAGVRAIMTRLRELGIRHLVMLTGDNQAVAQRVATQLGISEVQAELLPEDKLGAIQRLAARYGALSMTGDGVNDAPALATATVGIAMGGAGTAVALETADVALMADDLSKLPFAVALGRASRAIILQNLGIALLVILGLLVTSVLGQIHLGTAVVLHEGSTIVVVLNALRLLAYREQL